jgi:hypothetical protein
MQPQFRLTEYVTSPFLDCSGKGPRQKRFGPLKARHTAFTMALIAQPVPVISIRNARRRPKRDGRDGPGHDPRESFKSKRTALMTVFFPDRIEGRRVAAVPSGELPGFQAGDFEEVCERGEIRRSGHAGQFGGHVVDVSRDLRGGPVFPPGVQALDDAGVVDGGLTFHVHHMLPSFLRYRAAPIGVPTIGAIGRNECELLHTCKNFRAAGGRTTDVEPGALGGHAAGDRPRNCLPCGPIG